MELEEKLAKQKLAIEERKATCKELPVTERDHEVCREYGYSGCIRKFKDEVGEGMICIFCQLQ